MIYNVKCYYNTGFNRQNIPATPAVLENATSKEFPPVWKLQQQGLAQVKIKADWEEINNVDYVQIGDAYYTVSSISMLNNVALLNLEVDPINTVGGIDNFKILDGWVQRCHPATDALFQNIMDEPWTPRQELVMDTPVDMVPISYSTSAVTLIGATTDILSTEQIAKVYTPSVEEATDINVVVPQVKAIEEETTATIGSDVTGDKWEGVSFNTQTIPTMRLYTYENPDVKSGVAAIRSLGLENTLTACYEAPSGYINPVYRLEGLQYKPDITKVEGIIRKYTDTQPYKYGSYVPKNNKVYSMYNSYTVVAVATGDKIEYPARELYNDNESPDFYIYADPSPNGCPFCQPSYYMKKATKPFQNCVQGAKWLSTPITYDRPTREAMITRDKRLSDIERVAGTAANMVGTVGKAIGKGFQGDVAGAITEAVGTVGEGIKAVYEQKKANFDFAEAINVNVPDIQFARSAEIQGYIGNGFMIYRTHLSEADMNAFDKFLTMYGYRNSRQLTDDDLRTRKCFNFVQASNVTVTCNAALWLRNAIGARFENGIRLWHEMPTIEAMSDNPIKEG